MSNSYPDPVEKLFTYGDPRETGKRHWPDYREAGIGPEHIADLIRMTRDWRPYWEGDEEATRDRPFAWAAAIHAWRALGQLGAVEAIEPLLEVVVERDLADDDWYLEELPIVFGMIGEAAIAPLARFLADTSKPQFSRVVGSSGLEKIGSRHPELRLRAVAALIAELEKFATNDPDLNASIITELVELKGVEAAPAMRAAFKADRVDQQVCGDWDSVRDDLGLAPSPDDPPPDPGSFQRWRETTLGLASVDPSALRKRVALIAPPHTGQDRHLDDAAKRKKLRDQRKKERKARKKNRR